MDLEVIRGTRRGGVGEVTTTMYSPRQLLTQATDWATWPGFKWPDGNGGLRVRWWPFAGPTATMMQARLMTNGWPGSLFAVRLLGENEVPPGYAFQPGFGQSPSNSYYYYSQAQADQGVVELRAWLEEFIRDRLGITPETPIPDGEWDVQDVPYTRDSNGNIFGNFLEMIVSFFARINPLFVAARAAFLSLVKSNYRGLATKMAAKDLAPIRSKWRNWGGNWGSLNEAIDQGKDKTVTGRVGILPAFVLPVLLGGGGGADAGGKPDNDQSGGAGLGALLDAAKSILEPILSLLGINLDAPNDEEEAAENEVGPPIPKPPDEGTDTGTLIAVGAGVAVLAVAAVASTRTKKKRSRNS